MGILYPSRLDFPLQCELSEPLVYRGSVNRHEWARICVYFLHFVEESMECECQDRHDEIGSHNVTQEVPSDGYSHP